MTDDFLSLKETGCRQIRTNQNVRVDIGGKTRFKAEAGGRGTVAQYVNVKLPPAGSPERAALERGMVRTWFQQMKAEPDITGLDNVRRIGLWGDRRLTLAVSWPHTKDPHIPWEFCFFIEAWDECGKPVDLGLEMTTREVKVLGCKP